MTTKLTPAKNAGGTRVAPTGLKKNIKKPQKPKKPMPKFMVAVWCIVVFLVLLGGAGYCLYANVMGIAEKAMVLLPQYKASMDALDKRQQELDTREAALVAGNEKLAAAVKAGDKKAADLTVREEKLKADRKALDDRVKEAQTAEERRQAVVDIYASLDAGTAASMLLKAPTLAEAAGILKLLPPEKTAEILAEIEKTDAARAYSLAKLIGQ